MSAPVYVVPVSDQQALYSALAAWRVVSAKRAKLDPHQYALAVLRHDVLVFERCDMPERAPEVAS